MAKLFPTIAEIKKLKVAPTEGELHLLQFLNNYLNDDYEIFFQPMLNGDNPDIVIMRKDSGVMIIEVKDWHLEHYTLDSRKNWILKNDDSKIKKSPISQVLNYKQNLFDIHIENLLEKNIKDPNTFSIVTCAIYFHNALEKEVYEFLTKDFRSDKSYISFLKYFDILGKDSLSVNNFDKILQSRYLNRTSRFFDNSLYKSFLKHLMPPIHDIDEGIPIEYTKKQSDLIESKPGEFKIKGIAGSGKTFVLAKRAVNAHIRTNSKVLILTFNITLKNYIHDRISHIREKFRWDAFYIINYHQFVKQEMNNYGIPIVIPEGFDDWPIANKELFFNSIFDSEHVFEQVKTKIQKYQTIIVDEVQDYKTEWIRLIKKYFLDVNGELVVCGDEKQNIYERTLDNKLPNTTIPGRWNELNLTFRFTTNIANLALLFQNTFFKDKYNIDSFEIQQELDDQINIIEYYLIDNNTAGSLYSRINESMNILNLHPNNICILGNKIEKLKGLDYRIRMGLHQKTKTMFETQEIYNKLDIDYFNQLKDDYTNEIEELTENSRLESLSQLNSLINTANSRHINERFRNRIKVQNFRFEREIEKIRFNKKFNFWMNAGMLKVSTIHSFKGWEIHTLYLIIDDTEFGESNATAELIYTGLTRCRKNLIIINLGNNQYHKFFQNYVEKVY